MNVFIERNLKSCAFNLNGVVIENWIKSCVFFIVYIKRYVQKNRKNL